MRFRDYYCCSYFYSSVVYYVLQHIVIILIYSVHEQLALLDYQQITIYADNCCKGKNESFTQNSMDTEQISKIIESSHMKSFSVNRGLWVLSPETNYTVTGIIRSGNDKDRDDARDESLIGSCSSTARGNGEYTQYKSWRHVGNSFINLPGLSFYTNTNLWGDELYFDGTILKLPELLSFKSFGFTPRGLSWTIFNQFNYSGNATCLKSQDKTVTSVMFKQPSSGRSSSASSSLASSDKKPLQDDERTFYVGSIKRGCIKPDQKKDKQEPRAENHTTKIKPHHHHMQIITLHSKVNQHGSELLTDATELRLPTPHLFKSYSFVGYKNWTIFHGVEFNGPARCLHNPRSTPKSTLSKGNGSTIHQSIHLVVGSLKRGCADDPIKEVITPPPFPASTEGQTGGVGRNYARHHFFVFLTLNGLIIMYFIQ